MNSKKQVGKQNKNSITKRKKDRTQKMKGGTIIIDENQKRFFIWNDWKINEERTNEKGEIIKGDVLGMGSWGKIIVSDEKTVAKIPVSISTHQICSGFFKEFLLLKELHDIRSDIKTVTCNLVKGQPRKRGNIETNMRKLNKNAGVELSTEFNDETIVKGGEICVFFMERIYKPKKKTLLKIISQQKKEEYLINHPNITKPYYLFLGRISKASLTGAGITVTDVDSIPLSFIDKVSIMTLSELYQSNFILLCDFIDKNYPGTQNVVTNYLVSDESFATYYGRQICEYIWNVFLTNQIYLFDTEYVLGNNYEETQIGDPKKPYCYIIDFNRCEKGGTDYDKLVQSICEGMEINIEGTNPEHWGGFLPNPFISPEFAFRCWKSIIETPRLNEDIYLKYLTFMGLLTKKLNDKLKMFDKQITHKVEVEIKQNYRKQFIDNNNTFFIDSFELVPLHYFDIPKIIIDILDDVDTDVSLKKTIRKLHATLIQNIKEFIMLWKQNFLLEIVFAFVGIYSIEHRGLASGMITNIANKKLFEILPIVNISFIECLNVISAFNIRNSPPSEEDIQIISKELAGQQKPDEYIDISQESIHGLDLFSHDDS